LRFNEEKSHSNGPYGISRGETPRLTKDRLLSWIN